MEKTLSEEEKQRINALLEKHQPREETKEKEMVVLSEKGRKISIKTEVASSSMKPFEKWPVEHEEEASRRKHEVIGTDIETEYEEMDMEEEFPGLQQKLGPFQDHPHAPRVNILEKLSQCLQH